MAGKKAKIPAKASVAAKGAKPKGSPKKASGAVAASHKKPIVAAKGKSAPQAQGAAHQKKSAPTAAKSTKSVAGGKSMVSQRAAQSKSTESAAIVAKGKTKNTAAGSAPLTTLTLKPQEPKIEASGPAVCREVACELIATTGHYCRMHYIKNWKKVKRKEMILKERKLNHYIEELVSKYPDKYIEAIRQDLANEKDFAKVIADLEIDEGMDDFDSVETESAEGIIDNIKRDFEDEGDVF